MTRRAEDATDAVVTGLSPGERIVRDGNAGITDGQRVAVR